MSVSRYHFTGENVKEFHELLSTKNMCKLLSAAALLAKGHIHVQASRLQGLLSRNESHSLHVAE